MQPRIVVTRSRPWLRAAIVAGIVAALAIAGYAAYLLLRSSTVREFKRARTEVEQLQEERRDLARELRKAKADNAELRQQVVYAERGREIDVQACDDVKSSLSNLQAEVADLREQVAFYRGVVSPDETRAGVRVLELHVSPQGEPNAWRYDLVLIQSVRHEKRVSGVANMTVVGTQSGEMKRLDLASLVQNGEMMPRFAFKYFQEFGGVFRLPAGFRPTRVLVTLETEGDSSQSVEEEFDWGKIRQAKSERSGATS
jgi:hypothetical protein